MIYVSAGTVTKQVSYENKKILTIKGENNIIYLDGKSIVNYENELKTELLFEKEENGFTVVVNHGKKFCGNLTINIGEKISTLGIDTAGKYLPVSKQLSGFRINIIMIVIGIAAALTGGRSLYRSREEVLVLVNICTFKNYIDGDKVK